MDLEMKINHKVRQKSSTIVMTDLDGNTKTFTGWNFVAKKLGIDAYCLRSKWSRSDKSGPIDIGGNLIEKCIDNQE